MSVESTAQTEHSANHRRRNHKRHRRAVAPSAPADTRLRVALSHEGAVQSDPTPQQISAALQQEGDVVWMDVQGDPNASIQQLVSTFNLPGAIRESVLDDVDRARLLESRDIYSMIVHTIGFDEPLEEAIAHKLNIVFGQGFVVTIHREAEPWLDQLWADAHRYTGEENAMGRGLARLLHSILDALVDTYFPVINQLDDLIDQLEDATVNDTSNTVQVRLFRMKRAIATLRRIVSPQVELANSLITRTGALIPSDVEPYFADVRDHTLRAFEMLDSFRDLLSGLLDVYLTTVSNRLNTVMKQLTIIATIFMPITFITGVFGMNFGHMPQVEHDSGWNFWLVIVAMILISVAQVWYFRRREWM